MSTRSFAIALICIVLIAALVLCAAVREDTMCETYVCEVSE